MTCNRLTFTLLAVPLLAAPAVLAQQLNAGPRTPEKSILLNVVVQSRSRTPADDLTPSDFTVLDNGEPQHITSFKVANPTEEPVRVILLLDEVNADYNVAVMQRDGVNRYLRSNGGKLPYLTSLAILTDHGAVIQKSFLTDGNAIADALEHNKQEQRQIRLGTEFGEFDRLRLSLDALGHIAHIASYFPGRTIVICISPGWPLLSGMRFRMDNSMQNQFYNDIVAFSTQLRQAGVTLYDVDPVAVELGHQTDDYQGFVKGVSRRKDVLAGDLGLQVLALQSGGTVEQSTTNAMTMIDACLRDLRSWYVISYTQPPADEPNVYHHIEIKVDKPHVTVRTRDGYYANPTAIPRN